MIRSPGLRASATIAPRRILTISGPLTLAQAIANGRPYGISADQSRRIDDVNHALAGEAVNVHTNQGDTVYLDIGGTVTAGSPLKADADGKGVDIAGTGTDIQYSVGVALIAGADGDTIPVTIDISNERPALA